ncbi:MAG TPA: DUF1622 domain-containing protein [Burkholderiales bacterium]|nr:DUF1622 domain-containing protein [Burkholderiales bacterium]
MREWLVIITEYAILVIDALALIIIIIGTIEIAIRGLPAMFREKPGHERRDIWLRYARVLIAGLTLQLAADIIESAISTSWESIGRLAAIAVVRTFLNYFLERDMGEVRERQRGESFARARES